MVVPLPGFYEPASAFLHLGAAVVFVVLGVRLIVKNRGDRTRVALLSVFAFAGALMLSISGVYHMLVRGGDASAVLLRLDHAAIFVLIAGTFTPIQGLFFTSPIRWLGLIGMWAIAVTGVTLVTIFFNSMPRGLSTGLYIAMGWLAGVSLIFVWRRCGFRYIRPMVLGGIAYTLGAVFLSIGWPTIIPGVFAHHELWHIAVILGLALHWNFIARLAREHTAATRFANAKA